MAYGIDSSEVVAALLLVKAVLAILAVLLFIYYKLSWDAAKRHVPVHFFYAKWRAVRHAVLLGLAAVGFAIGFSLELIALQYGLSPNFSRFASGIFESGSLLVVLYVFFTLAVEDVPSFQHITESARKGRAHRPHSLIEPAAKQQAVSAGARRKKTRKKAGSKKR